MATVEIETGKHVKRFEFWSPSTWAIPKLYWDAFSQEQRIHAICRQLEKVIKYADYVGVNVDDIAERLQQIEDGKLDEFIVSAIETWFEENQPAIVESLEELQTDIANITLAIGSGFDADNTIADAIATESATRLEADTAINAEIEKLDEYDKDNFHIPNAIHQMEPLFRYNVTDCYYPNGGDVFESNGEMFFITAHARYENDQDSIIEVRDSNGNVTASLNTSLIGHGQNVTYLNGQAWITNRGAFDVTSNSGFAVFDVTTSSIVFNRVVYIPGFTNIFDATLDDENYYLIENNAVNVVNRESGEIIRTKPMSELGLINAGNGISLNKKYNAIVLNNAYPNSLSFISMDMLEYIGNVQISNVYGYVKMFEPEWVKVIDDDVYIMNFGGYGAYAPAEGKSDNAPVSLMHTNLKCNIGLKDHIGDWIANIADNQRAIINLDFTADAIPSVMGNNMTVKWPQDLEAIIAISKEFTVFEIRIYAECPNVIRLVNFNGFIILNAACAGLDLFGCHATITSGNYNFPNNSDKWFRGRGMLIMNSTVIISMSPGTYTGTSFATVYHSAIATSDAIWSHIGTKTLYSRIPLNN